VVLDQAVPTIDGLSAPIDVDSFESSSAVTVIASFAGTEKTFGASPPDLGIAAAPGVLVLSTNDSVSLLKKTGTPVRSTSLAAFFDGVKRPTQNVFDPRVLFDTTSNRFFLSATGFDCTSDPCVSDIFLAVSKSAGPKTLDSADWYFYSFDATLDGATPTAARADFPTFGINGPVVVFAFQMLSRDGAFEKEKIRVLNKSKLVRGQAVSWVDFIGMTDPLDGSVSRYFRAAVHLDGSPTFFLVSIGGANTCGSWFGGSITYCCRRPCPPSR
jgi:hypothetical protein